MKRFVWRAAGVALWLQVSAFAGQLALRQAVKARNSPWPTAVDCA